MPAVTHFFALLTTDPESLIRFGVLSFCGLLWNLLQLNVNYGGIRAAVMDVDETGVAKDHHTELGGGQLKDQ